MHLILHSLYSLQKKINARAFHRIDCSYSGPWGPLKACRFRNPSLVIPHISDTY